MGGGSVGDGGGSVGDGGGSVGDGGGGGVGDGVVVGVAVGVGVGPAMVTAAPGTGTAQPWVLDRAMGMGLALGWVTAPMTAPRMVQRMGMGWRESRPPWSPRDTREHPSRATRRGSRNNGPPGGGRFPARVRSPSGMPMLNRIRWGDRRSRQQARRPPNKATTSNPPRRRTIQRGRDSTTPFER